MIEIFNIALTHEYDNGKTSELYLVPFLELERLVFKDRLRFKYEQGNLRCFCEDDKMLVSENDYFFFWLGFSSTSIIDYTDFGEEVRFDSPKYIWRTLKEGKEKHEYVLEKENLDDNLFKILGLKNEPSPRNTIGLVAIKSEIVTEKISFELHLKTVKTLWQYRIQSDLNLQDWNFSIEDKKGELEFDIESTVDYLSFTSKTALPYFKNSTDRLTLKWKSKNDSFDFHNYKKQLSYPDYRYKERQDNKVVSPVYVKL